MQKDLLFEIGTEEIPSVYLTDMLSQLEKNTTSILSEYRTSFSGLEVFGTPRRMVLHVLGLEEFQESYTEEILGPPTKIGFDEEGEPTKATHSFLQKNNVVLSDLKTKETPKGDRLFLEKFHEGNETVDFLSSVLLRLITSLSSPKSMRWQRGNFQFVRPIRWILALYGEEIVPIKLSNKEFEEVVSCLPEFSNKTFGHRFLSDSSIEVKNFDDYIQKLNENFVNPISSKTNPDSRFRLIEKEVLKTASGLDSVPALGQEEFEFLIEKVSNLVEWPTVVQCNFDERYLKIPEEVIVNTLESNQRFFALKCDGDITSKFVAVSNIETDKIHIVKKGYERVVQARLEDAEFYWEKDLQISLEAMAEKLRDVVYHPKLGTSMEKVIRFSQVSVSLCEEFYPENESMKNDVIEISSLCKADLTSGMVYEFPELQGVMGKYFAQLQGKNEIISKGIYEHYLPIRDGDSVPSTKESAIVSFSDRLDTVVGLIGLNYIPKGSEDPYALRRTTSGMLKILCSFGLRVNLSDVIEKSMKSFRDIFSENKKEVEDRLYVFFSSRVHAFLMQNTKRLDLVESILSIDNQNSWNFPLEALAKLQLLEEIIHEEVFGDCSAICKRIFNITKNDSGKSHKIENNDFGLSKIDQSLFAQQEEKLLFGQLDISIRKANDVSGSRLDNKIFSLEKLKKEYRDIFEIMCTMTVSIDNFFDNVLIMDKDEFIKENRLNLLRSLRSFFSLLCDFTKIQK